MVGFWADLLDLRVKRAEGAFLHDAQLLLSELWHRLLQCLDAPGLELRLIIEKLGRLRVGQPDLLGDLRERLAGGLLGLDQRGHQGILLCACVWRTVYFDKCQSSRMSHMKW